MPVHIIRRFLTFEATSGMLLFFMALVALVLNNSPLSHFYQIILTYPLGLKIGGVSFIEPLLFWINDGLMAVFFLVIGLELKREFMGGELSGISKVILPGMAALGGMMVPAAIYIFFNYSNPITLRGWAVPIATDIAFGLGVLALFNHRVPIGLKLFLMALAIFDDLGAIIIIALFYTHSLSLGYLALSGLILLGLWGLNHLFKVRLLLPYLCLGVLLWVCILKSGVHPTVAGVLFAFMIPIRKRGNEKTSPLHHLEKSLYPWVSYLVLPLFAFANAGLSVKGLSWHTLFEPVVLGIAAGLFLGKQWGVFGFTWLIVWLGFAKLPHRTSWVDLYGVALLCGIGFTMSLFLGTLAFQTEQTIYLTEIRLGVLLGTLLSGLTGAMVLYFAFQRKKQRGLHS